MNQSGLIRYSDKDKAVLRCAFLAVNNDYSQVEIAETLGFSQAKVSKLLDEAKTNGWIQNKPVLTVGRIDKALLRELQDTSEESILSECFASMSIPDLGVQLRHIKILSSGTDRKGTKESRQVTARLVKFGHLASSYVYDHVIKNASCVAITWGHTLASLINGIQALGHGVRKQAVDVFPVCADLNGVKHVARNEFSSTRLADRLNAILNNRLGPAYSLTAFPGFLPHHWLKKEPQFVKDFVHESGSYPEIFSKKGRIHKADTLITSVGDYREPFGDSIRLFQAAFDSKYQNELKRKLKTMVVSDIGGALVPSKQQYEAEVRRMSEVWTGPTLEHIRGIAIRASRNQTPGVVVTAIGTKKSATVYNFLKLGLINTLVCDRELANDLKQYLVKDPQLPRENKRHIQTLMDELRCGTKKTVNALSAKHMEKGIRGPKVPLNSLVT